MDVATLIEAAKTGDVEKMNNLIKDEAYLLRAANLDDGGNALHIACIGGHVDFAIRVLILKPDFARELNQDGFSPLHIASGSGDIEIVKELVVKVGPGLCLIKGKEKRIPLHCAVVKGRVKVIRELVSVSLDSVREVTARGESCFHLAVKNNKFEAFKVLCEHVFDDEHVLNMKDEQGNTVLHLAALMKQYEVVDLLLGEKFGYRGKLEVNLLNKKGLTPLDVVASQSDGDHNIEEMLRLVGGLRSQEINQFSQMPQTSVDHVSLDMPNNHLGQEQSRRRPKSASKELQDYFKYDMIRDSPGKARNTLLVIAILIVTATYQAVLSPPGGVWQDDLIIKKTDGSLSRKSHKAGQTVMATHNPVSYGLFLIFNSVGFFMSLHMVNFLTLGLPLQFELRVALFALVATYDACMFAITPFGWYFVLFVILSILMPVIMPLLTKLVRDFKKGHRVCELLNTRESV